MPGKFALPELNNIRRLILPSLAIYIGLVFLMPRTGHAWDTACWGMWSTRIQSGGLAAAYTAGSPVNYLPLYLYVLKLYGLIFASDEIYRHLYLLKAFTLIFDMGSVLLLCSMIKPTTKRLKYFIYALLNIGFIYNTLVWNQVDGILTFFVFASFYFGMHKRISLSFLMYLLALNFKLQAIVFLPLLFLVWLPDLKLRHVWTLLLPGILLQLLIILPFMIHGNASHILEVASGSVDYFSLISLNAFNFWHLILDGDLMKMRDNVSFIGGLTYKHAGLILFMIFSALICVPLYVRVLAHMIRKQAVQFDMRIMLLAFSLIACFFFYFNTQMHERYIHPLIIFSTALAFLYRYWAQWVVFSTAYALSLESICQYLQFPNYNTLIFSPDFIACLYGISILLLLNYWFRNYKSI